MAACANGTQPQYGNAKRAIAEYRDEAGQLQLAPGWTWPADLADYKDVVDGDEIKYEINIGRVDAAWYWHCS